MSADSDASAAVGAADLAQPDAVADAAGALAREKARMTVLERRYLAQAIESIDAEVMRLAALRAVYQGRLDASGDDALRRYLDDGDARVRRALSIMDVPRR